MSDVKRVILVTRELTCLDRFIERRMVLDFSRQHDVSFISFIHYFISSKSNVVTRP